MDKGSKKTEDKAAAKEAASVSRKLMNTIKELQGKDGVALKDVKKYLNDVKKVDVKEASEYIKQAIKKNIDKGVLVRMDGLYKVNKPAQAKAPAAKRQASQAKAVDKVPAKVRKVGKTASSARAGKAAGKSSRVAKAKVQVAEAPEQPSIESAATPDAMPDSP